MFHRVFVMVFALALGCWVGCAPSEPHLAPAREGSAPQPNPGPPLSATWELLAGEVGPGAELTLSLVLRTAAHWRSPVQIEIDVPPEARVLEGETSLRWVPSGRAEEHRFELTLVLGEVPESDLVAEIDSHGGSAGVHARPTYRFAAPALPPLTPKTRRQGIVPLGAVELIELGPDAITPLVVEPTTRLGASE